MVVVVGCGAPITEGLSPPRAERVRVLLLVDVSSSNARIDAAARALGAGHAHTRYRPALDAAIERMSAEPGADATRDEVVLIANGLPYPVDASSSADALVGRVEALVASSPALRLHTVYIGTGTPAEFGETARTLLARMAVVGGGASIHVVGDEPLDLSAFDALRSDP